MNRPLDHLTDALVDQYARQGSGTSSAEEHLSGCEFCLDRVLMAQRVHFGLLEADPVNRAPYPECPNEQLLQELAAGICRREVAEPALKHAAQCDHCGPLLNRYLEEFSDELTREDQALISQLATAKPGWSERFVREQGLGTSEQVYRHSPEQRPSRKSFFARLWSPETGWWPKMAIAGALAIVLVAIAAGPYLWSRFELYRANQLVAAAYAERRTTEMRLTGVPHSRYEALGVERGDEDHSAESDGSAWHEARAFVGRKISEGRQDRAWLEADGRVALLQGTPRSLARAESALEKAHSQDKDDPSVEIDLAAAYFEQDSKVKPANLQRTINLLNEVLHQPKLSNQVRSVALFNLAIAYEKTEAWDMAVPIWEQYLRLDDSSEWAQEAQTHLKDAKSKLRPPRAQGYDHPSFFLSHAATHTLPAEVEEYQNIALELWLPRAVENRNSDSYKAVAVLADLLEKEHSDPWLKNFLTKLGPGDLPAVQALSTAVLANEEDLHRQALEQARAAAHFFLGRHNFQGELRARLEEVHALQRTSKADDCVKQAASTETRLSVTRYSWLQAQLFVEESSCRNARVEVQQAAACLTKSLKIADESHYPVLVLRNIAMSAGIKRRQHKYDESWKIAEEGVHRYWRGSYPPERLEQLYGVMWQGAHGSGFLYAAKALLEHTLEMREDPASGIPKDRNLEATLHEFRAGMFLALNEKNRAEEETRKVGALKGQTELPVNFNLVPRIDAANLQLGNGDADFALSTLKPVGELLKNSQDSFISLNYFQVLGATYLQLRQLDEAAIAYRSAIQMAENALDLSQDISRRSQWIKAAEQSYRGIVQVLLEQKKDADALRFWERYKGSILARQPRLRVSRNNNKTLLPRQLNVPFDDLARQGRLIYAVFDEGVQIWALSDKGMQSRWIKIRQNDLVQEIQEFVDQCAIPSSNLGRIQAQGQMLFSLLLDPVIGHISESQPVIVELDRATNELPMEALLSPDGWYFGAKYSVIYSHGVLMERDLRIPEVIGLQEPLLLVDAARSESGNYLPGEELERTTISKIFPNSQIVDAEHASSTEVTGKLRQNHIFHFIGHGKPDGEGAYLVLNKSQTLKAKDFSPDSLQNFHLAVLSACSTGVRGENGWLDTGNLVHSFLAGGVPSVIASRWNVDSENTAKLMSSFYQHLEKRETVAQSLYEARRERLTAQKHPYYWASFNLSGRAN